MNFVMIFLFAGVLFTQDPLTQNPAVMTINANYGLGEVSSCVTGNERDRVGLRTLGEMPLKSIIIVGNYQSPSPDIQQAYLSPANEVWNKVIFSQACVIPSVRGGGGRRSWQGGLHGRGHVWQGGMHGRGRGQAWQGGHV